MGADAGRRPPFERRRSHCRRRSSTHSGRERRGDHACQRFGLSRSPTCFSVPQTIEPVAGAGDARRRGGGDTRPPTSARSASIRALTAAGHDRAAAHPDERRRACRRGRRRARRRFGSWLGWTGCEPLSTRKTIVGLEALGAVHGHHPHLVAERVGVALDLGRRRLRARRGSPRATAYWPRSKASAWARNSSSTSSASAPRRRRNALAAAVRRRGCGRRRRTGRGSRRRARQASSFAPRRGEGARRSPPRRRAPTTASPAAAVGEREELRPRRGR